MRRRKKFAIYGVLGLLGGFAALVWLDMGTDPQDLYDSGHLQDESIYNLGMVGDPVPPRGNGVAFGRIG
jgi:hypothetical protein